MISVIIACLDSAGTLGFALESLVMQMVAGPWEIILADNGSRDESRGLFLAFAARHPELAMRVVDASDRKGKSYALNVGIGAARGDRLVFLDADDTVAPDWLDAMARALDRDDFVAARMDIDSLNPDWAVAVRPHPQAHDLMRLSHAPHCDFAGGATLGMRREVFDAVGGFDETMTCFEDNDFCIRAHLAGFRLKFAHEAVYNYRFRMEPEAIRRQAFAYAQAATLLRRRYAAEPRFDALAWLGLGFAFAGTGVRRLLEHVRGVADAPYRVALYQTGIGLLQGDLVGSLKHRVSPERRGFGGMRGRFKRWTGAAVERLLAPWAGSVVSVKTRQKLIALTFDDGPDPESTPQILDALAEVGAKATFFVIGSRAERHPELIARILAEGHEIGNHTFQHPSLPTASPDRVETELARTRRLLAPAGQALMRPPYGDQTFAVNRTARRLGYRVVLWSVSADDWLDHDAAALADRVCGQAHPGAIVLMHDSLFSFEMERYRDRRPTIGAIRLIAARLDGYRFVTVSQLLASGAAVVRARKKTSDAEYLGDLGFAEGLGARG